jgi:TPR repeat protein
LAGAYENGQGVTQDKTEALKWYRKVAAQGGEDAATATAKINEIEKIIKANEMIAQLLKKHNCDQIKEMLVVCMETIHGEISLDQAKRILLVNAKGRVILSFMDESVAFYRTEAGIHIAVEKNSKRLYAEGGRLKGELFKIIGIKSTTTGDILLLREVE